MPGVFSLVQLALIMGSVVDAAPKFSNARPRAIEIRAPKAFPQAPAAPTTAPAAAPTTPAAPGAAPALTDTDILQLYVLRTIWLSFATNNTPVH